METDPIKVRLQMDGGELALYEHHTGKLRHRGSLRWDPHAEKLDAGGWVSCPTAMGLTALQQAWVKGDALDEQQQGPPCRCVSRTFGPLSFPIGPHVCTFRVHVCSLGTKADHRSSTGSGRCGTMAIRSW